MIGTPGDMRLLLLDSYGGVWGAAVVSFPLFRYPCTFANASIAA